MEMVEKMVVEVSFLVEKEEEEEEGVVVVGMEEMMERRMVEELVAEMAEMVAGQGGHDGWFWAAVHWLLEMKKERKKK